MNSINQVFLLGQLARDPVLRHTGAGVAVSSFTLVVNERRKDSKGQIAEEKLFIEVTAWAGVAESVARQLAKDSYALVQGRLRLETWEKDGQKRSKITVTASAVQFLDLARGDRQAGDSGEQSSRRSANPRPDRRETIPVGQPGNSEDIPF